MCWEQRLLLRDAFLFVACVGVVVGPSWQPLLGRLPDCYVVRSSTCSYSIETHCTFDDSCKATASPSSSSPSSGPTSLTAPPTLQPLTNPSKSPTPSRSPSGNASPSSPSSSSSPTPPPSPARTAPPPPSVLSPSRLQRLLAFSNRHEDRRDGLWWARRSLEDIGSGTSGRIIRCLEGYGWDRRGMRLSEE